eukprot:TRINITY_DN975_c1_g2_i7.p2 TRINITY_DN975_c1_g2~~TRINITY_DN975_c1_g2_i7.p2  ORF type:complete len:116 (+),score=1.14 TRINITY_DN975_c1_g2_i7:3-350(+)
MDQRKEVLKLQHFFQQLPSVNSYLLQLPLMIDQQQQQQKSAGLLLQTQKQSYLAQHSEGQDSPSCICFAQQILTRPTKPSHSAGMQQQEQEQHLSKIKGPEIKGPEMLVDDIQFV